MIHLWWSWSVKENILTFYHFSNFLEPLHFTLHVEASHKINRILLISLQILVKLFLINRIASISYISYLSKYIQYKQLFFLWWLVVTSTHCNRLTSLYIIMQIIWWYQIYDRFNTNSKHWNFRIHSCSSF